MNNNEKTNEKKQGKKSRKKHAQELKKLSNLTKLRKKLRKSEISQKKDHLSFTFYVPTGDLFFFNFPAYFFLFYSSSLIMSDDILRR